MPSQVTVTAKYGPALQATATVIPNASIVSFHPDARVLRIMTDGGAVKEFDLNGVAGIACAISGANLSFTIT